MLEPFIDALVIAAFVFGPIIGGMLTETITNHHSKEAHHE